MTTLKKLAVGILATAATALAQVNVDPGHKFAWTENTGWTNWKDAGSGSDGVVVGPGFLRGYLWCENVGWIHVGDGTPADGKRYANDEGTDCGVNVKRDGDLFGLGWGENIGWVNFDTSDKGDERARFDTCERRVRGYAWGENVGWINLDDARHFVGTESPQCQGNIRSFRVSCSRRGGTLKILVGTSLPEGQVLHAVDHADNSITCLIINGRGKGKVKLRNQTGTHEICLIECPDCKEAQCP